MRILLVEDDEDLGAGIQSSIKQMSHTVDWITSGEEIQSLLAKAPYDLILLDLTLPRRSGLEILRLLRDAGNEVPVIVLTAKNTAEDQVKALDLGADDFIIKPLNLKTLHARIRAVTRRSSGRSAPLLEHKDIKLDPSAHTIAQNGKSVSLPLREFSIMNILLENKGKVVTKSQLTELLNGAIVGEDHNLLAIYIHRLRKLFGKEMIRTVSGVGYRLG